MKRTRMGEAAAAAARGLLQGVRRLRGRLRTAAGYLTIVGRAGGNAGAGGSASGGGAPTGPDLELLAACLPVFPLVGLALGAAQALVLIPWRWWSDAALVGPLAFGVLLVGTVLTGGRPLAELGRAAGERAAGREGVAGTVAVGLALLGKYAGLTALLALHSEERGAAMLALVPALARWSLVSYAALAPADGRSPLAGRIAPAGALAALAPPLALGLLLVGWGVLPVVLLASAVPVALARATARRPPPAAPPAGAAGPADLGTVAGEIVEVCGYLVFGFVR